MMQSSKDDMGAANNNRMEELQTALRLLQFLKVRLEKLKIDTTSLDTIMTELENEVGDTTPRLNDKSVLYLSLKDVIGSA